MTTKLQNDSFMLKKHNFIKNAVSYENIAYYNTVVRPALSTVPYDYLYGRLTGNCIAYSRVSTKKQESSLYNQPDIIKSTGLNIIKTYKDIGSGACPQKLRGNLEAVAFAKKTGLPIVCTYVDRFARNLDYVAETSAQGVYILALNLIAVDYYVFFERNPFDDIKQADRLAVVIEINKYSSEGMMAALLNGIETMAMVEKIIKNAYENTNS